MTGRAASSGSLAPRAAALDALDGDLRRIRPAVDAFVTEDRVTRYLAALSETPAPSTTATAMRGPVLHDLLARDGAFSTGRLQFDANFGGTGSLVVTTGDGRAGRPLWYFAHLDTISYLVQPFDGERHPLVPFCYHLTDSGWRTARAYRYDLATGRYAEAATGRLESDGGAPFFRPDPGTGPLQPGDRVVPVAPFERGPDGTARGHFDNAGGVAALAVAAPVLADAGVDALFAFPDEEEGPRGSGNQVMGRGAARIAALLPPPELAVVVDMQQAGEPASGGVVPAGRTRLGDGAVLSEFSSLARGAVTPPSLYMLARHTAKLLAPLGVRIQESNNAYTSRSDDVSLMLKTPNILLLGFPGFDRHFDRATPTAAPADIVHLAKALVYVAVLRRMVQHLAPEGRR